MKHFKGKVPTFNVLSLDSEANADGTTFVWCITGIVKGKKIEKEFYNPDDVNKFIKREHRNTILTGNNLLFDLNTLIYKGGFDWDIICNSGNFISAFRNDIDEPRRKIKCDFPDLRPREKMNRIRTNIKNNEKRRKNKSQIKIVELNNWYPRMSLLEIIDNPDYHKFLKEWDLPEYIDKHIVENYSEFELINACLSHCWAAVWALMYMQDKINKLGERISLTPSATAQNLHRRYYLSKVCQINDMFDKLGETDKLFMYQSVNGGRTENFKKGLYHNITGIDLNSGYPALMESKVFPDISTFKMIQVHDIEHLIHRMTYREGCATVKIMIPMDYITPLPYRLNQKLIFPSGELIGTWTYPELRHALKNGATIKEVYQMGDCQPMKESMFKEYVNSLYKLKYQPGMKEASKLMLNGLAGKFAQKENESSGWVIVRFDEYPEDLDNLSDDYEWYNGILHKFIPESNIESRGFKRTAFPLLTSYINAYQRIDLYDTMKEIGFKNIIYIDTDCIYGDADAISNSIDFGLIDIDDEKLGAWKIVHENTDVEIRGQKYYRVKDGDEWEYKIRNVPLKYQEEYWANHKITFDQPVKLPKAIRDKKQINLFIPVTLSDRENIYDKRIFIENNVSIPYHIT